MINVELSRQEEVVLCRSLKNLLDLNNIKIILTDEAKIIFEKIINGTSTENTFVQNVHFQNLLVLVPFSYAQGGSIVQKCKVCSKFLSPAKLSEMAKTIPTNKLTCYHCNTNLGAPIDHNLPGYIFYTEWP